MTEQSKRMLQSLTGKSLGLFVDNANWFYPQRELGWRISFSRLKKLLDSYGVVWVAFLYAGTPLALADHAPFQAFTAAAEEAGFHIITKPLKKIWLDRTAGTFVYKCNFDVEIALDIATWIRNVGVVMLGSGDSDFLAVKRFTLEHKKQFVTLCFERGVAWEMRRGHHLGLGHMMLHAYRQ